ncbi:hypothetical protein B0J13DRAFT_398835, partial [Dactylonectria estremocensis]
NDVLVNASGLGAQTLQDVREQNLKSWRLQWAVAKNDTCGRLFIRRSPNGYYSTAFSRLDGTVYCGGVLTEDSREAVISEDDRATICRRAHENQPDVFPSPDPQDWPILYDHVGVCPTMDNDVTGVRCAREKIGSQHVIHAYGQNAGGYVYSFGLGRGVVNLVNEVILEIPNGLRL